MDNENKNENSEVDLRDYLKLIFSQKWLFLCVFLAAIIIAVIYNFLAPKIYEVSTWLEIGKIRDTTTALVELIETPAQIGRKVNNDIYGDFSYNNAVILTPNQTDLIQIKIESVNPEKAKNDLEKISEAILADHAEKIKARKDAIENEIKILEGNINLLKGEAKNLEAKTETLLSKNKLFITKSILLNKNHDIEDNYVRIALLKGYLSNTWNTQIIKSAGISDDPVKPRSVMNIALAGMIGLFLGLLIVFWKKWWEDYKN